MSLWINLLPRLYEMIKISWYSYGWNDVGLIEVWNISILDIEVSHFQVPSQSKWTNELIEHYYILSMYSLWNCTDSLITIALISLHHGYFTIGMYISSNIRVISFFRW